MNDQVLGAAIAWLRSLAAEIEGGHAKQLLAHDTKAIRACADALRALAAPARDTQPVALADFSTLELCNEISERISAAMASPATDRAPNTASPATGEK